MKAVEKYYSIDEAGLLLSYSTATVLRRLKAGDFGAEVVDLGLDGASHDYRIPASGLNAFLEKRRVFTEPGIAARTVDELRRKVKWTDPEQLADAIERCRPNARTADASG